VRPCGGRDLRSILQCNIRCRPMHADAITNGFGWQCMIARFPARYLICSSRHTLVSRRAAAFPQMSSLSARRAIRALQRQPRASYRTPVRLLRCVSRSDMFMWNVTAISDQLTYLYSTAADLVRTAGRRWARDLAASATASSVMVTSLNCPYTRLTLRDDDHQNLLFDRPLERL
jgi:hypothetical protein